MSHDHAPPLRSGARHQRALAITFGLVVVFLFVEAAGAMLTGSLALLSDAGHMLTDAVGLGMALAAITLGNRAAQPAHRTFGLYRLEILAALANAVLLFGVGFYVLYEAVQRLGEPPEVPGLPMLVVAVVGLAVNLVGLWLLRRGAEESLNVEGAFLEVVADMVGSLGVIAAALILIVTGWPYADPLFGAAIGLFILPRAWRLGRKSLRILVEAAPERVDIEALRSELRALTGVTGVHDLHVWTLTSEMDAAMAHLRIDEDADPEAVLSEARDVLEHRHRVAHATLQIERSTSEPCASATW